jgi:hypothetical protein
MPLPSVHVQNEICNVLDKINNDFGSSISLTQKAWNMVISSPKQETFTKLFDVISLSKQTEKLISDIGGSAITKFCL